LKHGRMGVAGALRLAEEPMPPVGGFRRSLLLAEVNASADFVDAIDSALVVSLPNPDHARVAAEFTRSNFLKWWSRTRTPAILLHL
jgi:hypothetical protein